MQYWHQASAARPHLARMASDFCSAPGIFLMSWVFSNLLTSGPEFQQHLLMLREHFQQAGAKLISCSTIWTHRPSRHKWLWDPGHDHHFIQALSMSRTSLRSRLTALRTLLLMLLPNLIYQWVTYRFLHTRSQTLTVVVQCMFWMLLLVQTW